MLNDRRPARDAELTRVRTADWRWACALGLIVGLTLARLVTEAWPHPWRLAHLAPIVAVGAALGLAGGAMLWAKARRGLARLRMWPLAALCAYVVWPGPAFWLGIGLVAAVGTAVTILNVRRAPSRRAGLAILAGAFALYVHTCSHSILGADAGEFQLVTNVLGIAHPPGYALYTMMGRLFAWLPLGSPAFRINLFNAATSAFALYMGADLVRRETKSFAASLLVAVGLGLSATFWVQSTTANIRSLVVLLLILCIDGLLRWRRDPSAGRLAWLGLAFGLGTGHHSSLLLLAPAITGFVVAYDPGIVRAPRRWLGPLGAFAASLLVWLYLPIRSAMGSPFDPEPITSLSAFWQHVLALGFRGDMLHFRTLPELVGRISVFGQILRLELGWPLALGCVAGGVLLARRDWRALLLLGGIWLLNVASALTYRAPQTVEYLLPAYVSMLLVLALGVGSWRPTGWKNGLRVMMLSGLLVAALANGVQNYPSLRALREDWSDEQYAATLLEAVPEGALVLSNWHHATSMWYLQTVAGKRPDVDVVYVHPEGATPNAEVWLRRIGEGLAARPVVVTNWFYAYEHADYHFLPLASGWQALNDDAGAMPEDARPVGVVFDEGMRLRGVALEAEEAHPGEDVRVRIYWDTPRPLEYDYIGFVQLLGGDGVLGQGDAFHRADTVTPGVLQGDAHVLSLLWHAKPGTYRLIAGFYYLDEDGTWRRCTVGGADHVVVGEIEVTAQREPPASVHPMRVVFRNGLVLTGYDYDRGVAGQTRVYLHFRRPRAILSAGETEAVRVSLSRDGTSLGSAEVPSLEHGEAATVAVDLPGAPTVVGLTLDLPTGERLSWAWAWHMRRYGTLRLRLPNEQQRYVPLGGGVAYTGLQALSGGTPFSSEGLRLVSRWLALRPLTRDYAVSVGVRSDAGETKADGTPAMGAIPTLKWLRGWQVRDRRILPLKATETDAVQSYSVEMYDAFTLAPLQVLDERLVREGQGIRVLESPQGS